MSKHECRTCGHDCDCPFDAQTCDECDACNDEHSISNFDDLTDDDFDMDIDFEDL